jgi:hypothetical protein
MPEVPTPHGSTSSPSADNDRLHYLAVELARNIRDYKEIIPTLNMSESEFGKLWASRGFQDMLQEEKRKWLDTSNTRARVRLKTATAIEEALVSVFTPLADNTTPLGSRVNLLKILASMGGLDTPEPSHVSTGNTFRLEINYSNGHGVTLEMGGSAQGDGHRDSGRGDNGGRGEFSHDGPTIEGAVVDEPEDMNEFKGGLVHLRAKR